MLSFVIRTASGRGDVISTSKYFLAAFAAAATGAFTFRRCRGMSHSNEMVAAIVEKYNKRDELNVYDK